MTPEGIVKTQIRKFLTEHGIYWVTVQNGPGAKPGDPDLIICKDGVFVAIEVKSATGTLRPLQAQRKTEIERCGGHYIVVRSLDSLRVFLGI